MSDHHQKYIKSLCKALLLLKTEKETYNFLKDLCTPAELNAIAERWQICQCLNEGLSYREIHAQMGSSLTTISRVARFLKDEPYKGYSVLLERLTNQ